MIEDRFYLGGDRSKLSDVGVSHDARRTGDVKALMGRNCLIVGPAGSGKMSLVYGLLATVYPQARRFFFDFEIELSAQEELLRRLKVRRVQGCHKQKECWILRYIDRLPARSLSTMLDLCFSAAQSTSTSEEHHPPIVYATAAGSESIDSHKRATSLFPLRLTTTGARTDRHTLEQVARETLDELNRRYGRRIGGIEPSAIDLLLESPLSGDLLVLRSMIERAYIVESKNWLTAASFPLNSRPRRTSLGTFGSFPQPHRQV